MHARWVWAAALSLLLLLLQAVSDAATLAWRLDPTAVSHGQWWRLITAHVVHLSWSHTLLNVAGIWLCCALAPTVFDRSLFVRVAVLALGISLCLWWFSPNALPYVGFSGVLYGFFVLGLVPRALRRDAQAVVVLMVVTAWMLWPLLFGTWQAEEALIGGAVVAMAHVYGYGLATMTLVLLRGARACLASSLFARQRDPLGKV